MGWETRFPYSLLEVGWEVTTREQGRQGGGPGPAPPSLLARGPALVTCASQPCACHLPPPLASLQPPRTMLPLTVGRPSTRELAILERRWAGQEMSTRGLPSHSPAPCDSQHHAQQSGSQSQSPPGAGSTPGGHTKMSSPTGKCGEEGGVGWVGQGPPHGTPKVCTAAQSSEFISLFGLSAT